MASPDASEPPQDEMRERVSESRYRMWLILDADRWIVIGIISGSLFVLLVAIGLLHPTPARQLLSEGDLVQTMAQPLVTSTITGVTIVLTLSQLVLSQELGAAGDQRDRMAGAMEFREDVARALDRDIAPAEPAPFLAALVEGTETYAEGVEAAIPESHDRREIVESLVQSVQTNTKPVLDALDGARFGRFEVLSAALNYNYSWKLYAAQRLQAESRGELSATANAELESLIENLKLYGAAREHVKTLYFQWELSTLSQQMLYAAVPALAVAAGMLFFLEPTRFTGSTLGISNALLLVAAATTAAVSPFSILLAYILRIVTVTKRTLSIGPFILRETDRTPEVDWVD